MLNPGISINRLSMESRVSSRGEAQYPSPKVVRQSAAELSPHDLDVSPKA